MEEQNKTTESGQAAADLDKSLAHLETATRLTGLVVELQKAAANLEAYAASLLGSDDIIVDKAASLILHLNRKVIRLMQRLDDGPCINPLPRNATPQMVEKFIQRSAADTMHIMRQAERSIR